MSIAGTLPAILRARCRDSAARVALREKRNGIWREHTWNDYWERARAFGLGLVAIGVRPGDRVAIHSEDRPEWLFARPRPKVLDVLRAWGLVYPLRGPRRPT